MNNPFGKVTYRGFVISVEVGEDGKASMYHASIGVITLHYPTLEIMTDEIDKLMDDTRPVMPIINIDKQGKPHVQFCNARMMSEAAQGTSVRETPNCNGPAPPIEQDTPKMIKVREVTDRRIIDLVRALNKTSREAGARVLSMNGNNPIIHMDKKGYVLCCAPDTPGYYAEPDDRHTTFTTAYYSVDELDKQYSMTGKYDDMCAELKLGPKDTECLDDQLKLYKMIIDNY